MQYRVYEDPCHRSRRLNLIEGVTGAASSSSLRLEDQLTEFLAWLVDRSDTFAKSLLSLFLDGDQEAQAAVSNSPGMGATTQVHLPRLAKGHPRPDLSIAGCKRAFQLLVEVKAEPDSFSIHPAGTVPGLREQIDQVRLYLHAWETQTDPAREAKVRRLGTLTPDGVAPKGRHAWRAKDISWLDVADRVADVDQQGELEGEVAEVARELRGFLNERFRTPTCDPAYLEWGCRIAAEVGSHLSRHLEQAGIDKTFATNLDGCYAGGYLRFTAPEGNRETLWIAFTIAGGRHSDPAAPDALSLAEFNEEPFSDRTSERLAAVGFRGAREKAGYKRLRIALPVDAFKGSGDFEAEADAARAWALELMQIAGLT